MLSQLADRYTSEIEEKLAEVEVLRSKLREIQALQSSAEQFPEQLTS